MHRSHHKYWEFRFDRSRTLATQDGPWRQLHAFAPLLLILGALLSLSSARLSLIMEGTTKWYSIIQYRWRTRPKRQTRIRAWHRSFGQGRRNLYQTIFQYWYIWDGQQCRDPFRWLSEIHTYCKFLYLSIINRTHAYTHAHADIQIVPICRQRPCRLRWRHHLWFPRFIRLLEAL